jgi:hypothetical protein
MTLEDYANDVGKTIDEEGKWFSKYVTDCKSCVLLFTSEFSNDFGYKLYPAYKINWAKNQTPKINV